jgi:NAD(P)-dependent dehydrogenase (short-subunit alcohol dehydrogenase family)
MRQQPLLRGKTALITGGSRGIGRAIALAFAREEADAIAILARQTADLEAMTTEIKASGCAPPLTIVADVGDDAQLEQAIQRVTRELGHIDVLVNNAGGNVLGAIESMNPEVWWKQMEVNVKAPYLLARAFVPQMVARKWGRVINMSSRFGKIGAPLGTSYCSAKHAIIGFTRALALEVAASGVTVNAICPGQVDTDLINDIFVQRAKFWGVTVEEARQRIIDTIPQKRLITPEEIVPTALFLISDGAARTTGEAINVSSGSVMH